VLEVSLRGSCGSGGVQASGWAAAAAGGAAAACGRAGGRAAAAGRGVGRGNLAGLGAGACGIGFPLSTTVSCVPS
jgi:hypothetical protein